jgi:hypothetical protein
MSNAANHLAMALYTKMVEYGGDIPHGCFLCILDDGEIGMHLESREQLEDLMLTQRLRMLKGKPHISTHVIENFKDKCTGNVVRR